MNRLGGPLQRVGGPAGITRATFIVVAVFATGIQVADMIDSFTPEQLPARVLIIVIPLAVLYGVLLAGRRLLLRDVDRRPRPGRTIAIFVAAALARGAAIAVLFPVLLGFSGNPAYRLTASVLTLVPTMIVTALIVAQARERAARRAELERALRRLEAASAEAEDDVRAAHEQIVERVRAALLVAVDDSAGAAPEDVVARLRSEVNDGIRPLSHRLAREVPAWSPVLESDAARGVPWRTLWRDVTLGRPFRPILVGTIAGLMTGPAAVSRVGVPEGLLYPMVLVASLIAVFMAAQAYVAPLLERIASPSVRAVVFLGAVVASCTAGVAIVSMAVTPIPALSVAVAVMGPVVAILVAVAQAVDANVRQVEADLEATTIALDRAVTRVHQVAWQRQRVLALAIHGPLQAKVSAAALRLEQRIADGTATSDAVDEALRTVLGALDEIDLATDAQSGDLRADLADVAEAWEGVCAIDVAVDGALAARIDRDPTTARVVVDVFTEACSNAVRHARAREIDLRIDEADDGLLRVVVEDDGRPGATSGSGLGTALLDEIAVRWERRSDAASTRLEVVLPPPQV